MNPLRRPKKCPKCNSGRILIRGSRLICQRPGCGYENDINPQAPVKSMNWKTGRDK